MSKLKKIIVITAVLVLALLAIGATVVLAAPDGQGIDIETEAELDRPPVTRELLEQIFDREEIKAVIADTLGLTVEELDEAKADGVPFEQLLEEQGVTPEDIRVAVQDYKTDAVETALDEGLIDEAQAEWLLAHDGRRLVRAVHTLRQVVDPEAMRQTAADALGISVEELDEARAAGTTLPELADEQGVPLETVHAALRDAFVEMVEQAADDGVISQFQANRILNHIGRLGRFINGASVQGE